MKTSTQYTQPKISVDITGNVFQIVLLMFKELNIYLFKPVHLCLKKKGVLNVIIETEITCLKSDLYLSLLSNKIKNIL